MTETENNSQHQKPKTSKLAIIAILPIMVVIAFVVGSFVLDRPLVIRPWSVFTALLLLFCLVMGIGALREIKRSSCPLRGKGLANITVIISVVGLILFISLRIMLMVFCEGVEFQCGTNLSCLGKTISLYANDFDHQYPTADKWCDLLIQYVDTHPSEFVCEDSDAVEGESSYAFNKYLVGKKASEVPDDVVLLFETNFGKNPVGRDGTIGDRDYQKALGISNPKQKVYKLRWNQVGGPEILTTENHQGKYCNVLFNDIHVEFVTLEKLKELKWKPEEVE